MSAHRRCNRWAFVSCAALLACLPKSAHSADASEPPLPAGGPLSLIEAVQLGVAKNLDLLAQRLRARSAELLARAAWRPYSPSIVLDASLRKSDPTTDAFNRERTVAYSAGVVWQTPVGTTLSATVNMNQGVNAAFDNSRGLQKEGALNLSIKQPLLKDAWFAGAAQPLQEADLQNLIERELFKEALNDLIVQVETAYWDLAVAESDVTTKTRSRDRAKSQYDDTAENIRRGILASGEIYVVEDNLLFFEQELLRAEASLELARRHLAVLLGLGLDSSLSTKEALKKPELLLPDRPSAIALALQSNPRVLAQKLRASLAETRFSLAFNQALPALDLWSSLALAGADPVYSSAWSKLIEDRSPDARVGVSLSVPLDQVASWAKVESAKSDSAREEATKKSVELTVSAEIENGLTSLATHLRLLALAEKQVEVAGLKLSNESDKYKNGVTTLADVVRFQRDLDSAFVGLQRVIRNIYVSHANLLAGQGILYDTVGVGLR